MLPQSFNSPVQGMDAATGGGMANWLCSCGTRFVSLHVLLNKSILQSKVGNNDILTPRHNPGTR